MIRKYFDKQREEGGGMFHKLMHGLTGSFFHGGEPECSVNLDETRGVGIRIEKLNCKEQKIREIIREKLAMVGLEGKEGLNTSELSGGMKKRVAVARSLAMNPDLILYDEPTAELDPINTDELANTILKLKEN